MDVYMGLIFPSALTFAPQGLMYCQGQLLSINTYTALYAVLGINYGGDARTTFGIPDLRGRMIVGAGTGPGLTPRVLGQKWGAEINQLSISNLPAHSHSAAFTPTGGGNGAPLSVSVKVSSNQATEVTAGTNNANTLAAGYYPDGPGNVACYVNDPAPTIPLTGVTATGGGGGITGGVVSVGIAGSITPNPFSIMPPFTVLNYLIVVEGIFPPRN